MISSFTISSDFVRVGLVTYSSRGVNEFNLNSYNNKESLLRAISKVMFSGNKQTNLASGLKEMHSIQFNKKGGDRIDVPNIAVIISHGASTVEIMHIFPEAKTAQRKNIHIFSIGIGQEINEDEVMGIVSQSKGQKRSFWRTDHLEGLNKSLPEVLVYVCEKTKEVTTIMKASTAVPTPFILSSITTRMPRSPTETMIRTRKLVQLDTSTVSTSLVKNTSSTTTAETTARQNGMQVTES